MLYRILYTCLFVGLVSVPVKASEEAALTEEEKMEKAALQNPQIAKMLAELKKPCPTLSGDVMRSYAEFGRGVAPVNKLEKLGITYTRGPFTVVPLAHTAIEKNKEYAGEELSKQDGWIDCHYDLSAPGFQDVVNDLYKAPKLTIRKTITSRSDSPTCLNIAIRIFHAKFCDPTKERDPSLEITAPGDYDLPAACNAMQNEIDQAGADGKYPNYNKFKEQIVAAQEGTKQQFTHTCRYGWKGKAFKSKTYLMDLNGVSAF